MNLEELGILRNTLDTDAHGDCDDDDCSVEDCESTGTGNSGNDVCTDCN